MTPPERTGAGGQVRVGFVVDLDQSWLGGINYFRNLLTAIYDDPERAIDAVFFIGRKADPDGLKGLPLVETIRTSMLDPGSALTLLRRALKRLMGRDALLDRLLVRHRIDVLSHSGILGPGARTPVASWIADFQHIHLPSHFTADERAERSRWFDRVCAVSRVVILSSESARGDLVRLFPGMEEHSEVLRFVPHLDVREGLPERADLERRYGFSGQYIYLPNQYWAHKNHRIVIEALALLQQSGRLVTIVSTGNPADYRNPDHYATLTRRIDELGLDDRYRRLGVVPYRDLLALIRHSVCLINPSLFEGWSTTVEEARAMDKFIILSDIPVHREQAPAFCTFFPPEDAQALAGCMWEQWQTVPVSAADQEHLAMDHLQRRRAFARRYHEIIAQTVRERDREAAA